MTLLSVPFPAPTRTRATVTVRRRIRPLPAIDISRMTRYRGGTYSHTVDTVVFTDGTSARTDLIRLNPNIEAYSLDFAAVAPTRPSHYQVENWSVLPNLRARRHEPEVDWILRNSYPNLRPAELSRRLRAAGYPLGSANISEHEAIAGTQAAIWYLTNGLELDNRPLNVPVRVDRSADTLTFEFDGQPELGGYTVDLVENAAVTLTLQKSTDGRTWRKVTASAITAAEGAGSYNRTLGVGSTVSASRHGRAGRGHRYYRLTVSGGAGSAVADVRFWLHGSGNYRNSDRIVHLYNYLRAGAQQARARWAEPRLTSGDALHADGLVGPFRLHATHSAALAASSGTIVDAAGAELTGPFEPGSEFFLRPGAGETVTVTMRVPGTSEGHGGRVLTGVARDAQASRFTPVALAVPAQLLVEFDIDWRSEPTSQALDSSLRGRTRAGAV